MLPDEGFDFMAMADEAGFLAGKGETKNVSEEEFFIKCRETLQPFISDVTIDENDRPIITVAVPYIEDDVFKGVMYSIQRLIL